MFCRFVAFPGLSRKAKVICFSCFLYHVLLLLLFMVCRLSFGFRVLSLVYYLSLPVFLISCFLFHMSCINTVSLMSHLLVIRFSAISYSFHLPWFFCHFKVTPPFHALPCISHPETERSPITGSDRMHAQVLCQGQPAPPTLSRSFTSGTLLSAFDRAFRLPVHLVRSSRPTTFPDFVLTRGDLGKPRIAQLYLCASLRSTMCFGARVCRNSSFKLFALILGWARGDEMVGGLFCYWVSTTRPSDFLQLRLAFSNRSGGTRSKQMSSR